MGAEKPSESGAPASDEFGQCYESPAAGLKDLASAYDYWTGKITDSSLQLCLAIVAGNWAVHQNRAALLQNKFALVSLSLVLTALMVNLVGAFVMARLNRKHFYTSQANRRDWIEQWRAAERTPMEWPFTHQIGFWGYAFTIAKVAIVLIAGLCLVIGAFIGTDAAGT